MESYKKFFKPFTYPKLGDPLIVVFLQKIQTGMARIYIKEKKAIQKKALRS